MDIESNRLNRINIDDVKTHDVCINDKFMNDQ